MYCEYWNLEKPPFDNVPDAMMYVDGHTSMESAISEVLYAIKEANEAFAVIIGAAGLGKTLSLRMIIDALDPRKYKIALITNPGLSYSQLLKEIIGQITGTTCAENRKVNLLEIFNHLLLETISQGARIVILIDEASTLSAANLENLRLLTNMQDGQSNLFSVVLAGQQELAERLEHPKRANLFQRISTYVRIDKLPSEEALKSYIETRLQFAGTKIKIFSDECIPVIWEYSEYGVPRLINRICKLCLSVGETNKLDYIHANVVLQITERFQKLSKSAVQKRKPRIQPDDYLSDDFSPETLNEETAADKPVIPAESQNLAADTENDEPNPEIPDETEPVLQASEPDIPVADLSNPMTPEFLVSQEPPVAKTEEMILTRPTDEPSDEQKETAGVSSDHEDALTVLTETPFADSDLTGETTEAIACAPSENTEDDGINVLPSETVEIMPQEAENDASIATTGETYVIQSDHPKDDGVKTPDTENPDEIIIDGHRIKMNIPEEILKQVKSFNKANANKSAGFWAAQIIKRNPQLTRSPHVDPVLIWNEIRDGILKKIAV